MTGDSTNSLESFQIYAGKKIQRLYLKSPNICSIYGLGWMRLTRFVQIQKLIFVRALLSLDPGDLSRIFFVERATHIFNNNNDPSPFEEWSIVADLLYVAEIFNLSVEIRNMVLRGHQYAKDEWRKIVWIRGWSLEDTHWSLEARLYKDLDLIVRDCPSPRYLTWWSLSNKFPEMINVCENLVKLICHASLLKCDDVRLKSLPPRSRTCSLCDSYAIEDPYHVIMQCPGTQPLRNEMFAELESDPKINEILNVNANEVMLVCLGKCPIEAIDATMVKLWCISGRHINGIYRCCRLIFPCVLFSRFFPECYQTGMINTGKIYTVHVRT